MNELETMMIEIIKQKKAYDDALDKTLEAKRK